MDSSNSPSSGRGTKPSRKPRRQAQRRDQAMTTIIDCAEKLFALHGPDGVTVRALAKEAKVDPALVHYYFGDMEAVFRTVFHRKADLINPIRNRVMDEYMSAHGAKPTVEGVFEAFLRPVFETIWSDPKNWTHYVAIVGYANASPFGGRKIMREAYDVTVHRFIDLLRQLAPEVPAKEIYWFYHLMSGSLSVSLAQTGRIDALSGGLCKSSDIRSVYEALMLVYPGGFETLRARYAKPVKGKRKK